MIGPRSCVTADGHPKRAYSDMKQAKAKKRKGQVAYQCRNCDWCHLASKHH